jgi:hypothetical protein
VPNGATCDHAACRSVALRARARAGSRRFSGRRSSNTTACPGVVRVMPTMRDDPADEDELLRQVADGDMRALEALYRGTRVQVFAVALAAAGDRGVAEDVVQDTFVRVHSAAPRYRPGSRARAWVLTIARCAGATGSRWRGCGPWWRRCRDQRRSCVPDAAGTVGACRGPVAGDPPRGRGADCRRPAG